MLSSLRLRLALIFVSFSFAAILGATEIRVQTLGQLGTNVGSLHYQDERNIFYNPAELLRLPRNTITFQEGEGGYYRSTRDRRARYAFHYGRPEELFSTITTKLSSYLSLTSVNNKPMTLFIARPDRGANWGVSVNYLNAEEKSSTTVNSEYVRVAKLTLGRVTGKADYWLGFYALHEGRDASSNQEAYEGDASFDLGIRTRYGKGNQFFTVKRNAYSYGPSTSTSEFTSTEFNGGYGRSLTSRDQKLTYYWGAAFTWFASEDKTSSTTTEVTRLTVPLNFAVEYRMFPWLMWRAGAVYTAYKSETTETSSSEAKEVVSEINGPEIGGTISHKNFHIDFKYNGGFDQGTTGSDGVNKIGEIVLSYNW